MEIEDKYIFLLGKSIYNKTLNKFGYISSLEIMDYIKGYGINLIVYYDTFHNHDIAFIDDFKKGVLQFVIVTDYESIMNCYIEDIKAAFANDFFEDMILYISEDDKKAEIQKNNESNIQMLSNNLISLTRISAHVIANDFWTKELYLKYKNKKLTEKEMLYAMVNYLAHKTKRLEDSNTKYFFKYELFPEIEEKIKEELSPYE